VDAQEEEKDRSEFVSQAVDLYSEALTVLARVPNATPLSIEAAFQLARYLLRVGQAHTNCISTQPEMRVLMLL
jgi:hypothetical protein